MDEDNTASKRFRRVLLETPMADCIMHAKYPVPLPRGGLYFPTQLTQEWPCHLRWQIKCGLKCVTSGQKL